MPEFGRSLVIFRIQGFIRTRKAPLLGTFHMLEMIQTCTPPIKISRAR